MNQKFVYMKEVHGKSSNLQTAFLFSSLGSLFHHPLTLFNIPLSCRPSASVNTKRRFCENRLKQMATLYFSNGALSMLWVAVSWREI